MLFILLTVICTFPGIHVGAQQLAVVNNGSKVEFSVDNGKGIGEKIKGKFSNLSGNIIFDPQHLAWTLENLVEGKVVNQIKVPEHEAILAKTALDRMLAVS